MSGSGRGPIDCPRCGKPVAADQDWCLSCGAPARTKIVRAPHWRRAITVFAALAALSIAAFALAYVDLTKDPKPPTVTPVDTIRTVTAPVAPAAPAP